MALWISTRPELHTGFLDSDDQEAHITLGYVRPESGVTFDQVYSAMKYYVAPRAFPAHVQGFGTWIIPEDDEGNSHVLYAAVSSPHNILHSMQNMVAKGLDILKGQDGEAVRSTEYPFVPHITLSYSEEPYVRMPALKSPHPFMVDNLFVSEDGDHAPVWTKEG